MDLQLTDRVAVVTGASTGIGEASVVRLPAAEGATVVGVFRSPAVCRPRVWGRPRTSPG